MDEWQSWKTVILKITQADSEGSGVKYTGFLMLLACLYEHTGRAIALPLAELALAVKVLLYSFLYKGQRAFRNTVELQWLEYHWDHKN